MSSVVPLGTSVGAGAPENADNTLVTKQVSALVDGFRSSAKVLEYVLHNKLMKRSA